MNNLNEYKKGDNNALLHMAAKAQRSKPTHAATSAMQPMGVTENKKINMNKLKLTLIALFFARIIVAQNLSPTVVNSSGGVIQNSNHSLEWSLGELAVSTLTSPVNLLTQGFLQPTTTIVGTEAAFDESRFSAFPNPVSDWLNLQTDIAEIETVQIHDVLGKVVLQSTFQPSIDVHQLNSGVYIVSLFNGQNLFLHSFKISKI